MAPSNSRKTRSRLKRKLDVLTEDSSAPEPPTMGKATSFTEIETGELKKMKLSARDLLATLSGRRITITEIKFAGNSYRDGGTYADVAVASLGRASSGGEKGRTVAVKKLRFVLSGGMTEEKFLRAFVNELRVLDKLSHPNIVEIIGFVEDIENRITWLVFPWEDNGNLREFLRSGKWELPERVSLIRDVSLGLEYLHTRQPPICHGDLKSLNILVNSEYRAVISDFGSARIIREIQELDANPAPYPTVSASCVLPKNQGRSQFTVTASDTALTLTGPACSFRWAPPEVLIGGALDLASDIWALGWIAWEAITDRYPFEELKLELDVTMRIIEGKLPLLYDHGQLSQIDSLCRIMLSCWNLDPKERPSATECWKILQWTPSAVPTPKSGEQPTVRSAILFMQLGEIHRLKYRYKEARKMYEQGLAIARSTGDQSVEAQIYLLLAEVHRTRCNYAEAEAFSTQALAILRSIGKRLGQGKALVGLGQTQKMRFDLAGAESSFTQAMGIYESIGNDPNRANALRGLAGIQQLRYNFVEAEAAYTQALAIYTSIGDDVGQADTMLELGEIQRLRSNYVEAEASYNRAIAVYVSTGDHVARARGLVGLGLVQKMRSDYGEAEASYTQAITIHESIGNSMGRATALLKLGELHLARSNYPEAEASYVRVMAISESIGAHVYQAHALFGLGLVQKLRSDYVEAEASCTQAMTIYEGIGDNANQAHALHRLGEVQEADSNSAKAEASYGRALAIFRSIGDRLGLAKSSLKLSKIYLLQGRYSEARALIDDAAGISEQIDYSWGKRYSKHLKEALEAVRPSSDPLTHHTAPS